MSGAHGGPALFACLLEWGGGRGNFTSCRGFPVGGDPGTPSLPQGLTVVVGTRSNSALAKALLLWMGPGATQPRKGLLLGMDPGATQLARELTAVVHSTRSYADLTQQNTCGQAP